MPVIVFFTVLILLAFYFIIKSAVRNGMKQAYKDITGLQTAQELEEEKKKA